MTKDTLFHLLMNGLESDSVNTVFMLVTQHNEILKTLDAAQLSAIDTVLRSSSKIQNPNLFRFFIETFLYKKGGGGAGAFINAFNKMHSFSSYNKVNAIQFPFRFFK